MLLPLMLEYQKSRQNHTLTFLLAVLACCLGEKTECSLGNYIGSLRVCGYLTCSAPTICRVGEVFTTPAIYAYPHHERDRENLAKPVQRQTAPKFNQTRNWLVPFAPPAAHGQTHNVLWRSCQKLWHRPCVRLVGRFAACRPPRGWARLFGG